MSIQETINSENLNKLHNYYDKFTKYFPDWGKFIASHVNFISCFYVCMYIAM